MNKKLSKYIVAFDYTDKALIVLSATNGGGSIISFASVILVPAGIANASFNVIFSMTTGVTKKVLKIIRKKEEHNKIAMLAKLN